LHPENFFYKGYPLRSNILWINETVVESGKTIEPHSHKSEEEIWYIIHQGVSPTFFH
jgi:hypothetical protein